VEAQSDNGLRALVMGAAFVVVVAGVQAAAGIVVPILIAGFLAVLSVSPIKYLQKRGLGETVAAVVVFLGVLIVLSLLSVFVGASLRDFDENLPVYQRHLRDSLDWLLTWIAGQGLSLNLATLRESVDPGAVVDLAGSLAAATSSVLSNTLFILLTVAFILAEVAGLPRKLRVALDDPDADLEDYGQIVQSIQDYLAIKTKVSLGTGLLVFGLTAAFGVDYPLLWGLVAFMLNFVPTIGSIIAAIPAVLLAFVQFGPERAVGVLVGYLVINVLIGSVLEPRLMGRRLGLSPLVVFLSLVFWGWILGPAGMLLSVPLTMVLKILLEHSDDLRWIAVLLGPEGEVEHHEREAQARAEESLVAMAVEAEAPTDSVGGN
jgi:predicted PurR-regulated permease PerM